MTQRSHDRLYGLGFLVADINRLMRKEFDRRVRHLGLTRSQWLFLSYLSRQPGCTQSELAESLQMEKITVSRQAARLMKSGWVTRRDRADDGRAYHLHPTAKAHRMIDRLVDFAVDLRRDYLRGMSPARQVALRDDLTLIKTNLLAMEANGKNSVPHHTS